MLRKACMEMRALEMPMSSDTRGDEAAWRPGALGLGRKVAPPLSSSVHADLEADRTQRRGGDPPGWRKAAFPTAAKDGLSQRQAMRGKGLRAKSHVGWCRPQTAAHQELQITEGRREFAPPPEIIPSRSTLLASNPPQYKHTSEGSVVGVVQHQTLVDSVATTKGATECRPGIYAACWLP